MKHNISVVGCQLEIITKGSYCECCVEYTLTNRARLDAALNCIPQLYVILEARSEPECTLIFKAPVLN